MSLFVTQRSFDFLNHVNDALINKVIQNSVVLYKISLENTGGRKQNLYGEAIDKDYSAGTQLYCIIETQDQSIEQEGFGSDIGWEVRFGFHRNSLQIIDVYPEIGDIIEWNDAYFEVDHVIENTIMGGVVDFKVGFVCDTHMTRRSRLQIEQQFRG
jgi:hypothetical protein